MAPTHARAVEIADEFATLSRDFLALMDRAEAVLAFNSAHSIDWGAAQKPAFLVDDPETAEDPAPNLQGHKFSRQQLANAVGSFAAFATLLGQGHRGNLELVSKPRS